MENLTSDTAATLLGLDGELGQTGAHHGGPVFTGTLKGAILRALKNGHDNLWRYSIATDEAPLITSDQILAVADRFGLLESN